MSDQKPITRKQLNEIQRELFNIHGLAIALRHYHVKSSPSDSEGYSDVIETINDHIVRDAEKALDILNEVM